MAWLIKKTKRVKKKNLEEAPGQEKNGNTRPLTKSRFREQRKDKEAVSSVFQTSIIDVFKRQLSNNRCKEQMKGT